ncbi:MAG: hypothetical protein FJX11_22805 [Alphaproteobacteria bacterium]|nr:hypothetical protein [Alphaproteobacteria bacterium]
MWIRPLASFAAVLLLAQATGQAAPLNCTIGPVAKTFAGNTWLVHGCDDDRTLILVAAPGNPAAPFYFLVYPAPDGRLIVDGEGAVDRRLTAEAAAALARLSDADIANLIAEAKRQAKHD